MPRRSAQPDYRVSEAIVWAVFFSVIALAFDVSIQSQFTLPKLFSLRVLLPLIVLLWLIRVWRGGVKSIPASVLASAGALGAWWVLTTVLAVDPLTALQGMHGRYNGLTNHLLLAGLFFLLASTDLSQLEVEGFLTLFVVSLVPVAIYAIAQNLGFDPITWPNPRPASTIGHPVPLAAILTLGVPFVSVFLTTTTGRLKRSTWAVVLALFLVAIAATLSRGPWIDLILAIVVLLLHTFTRRTGWTFRLRRTSARSGIRDAVVLIALVLAASWNPAAIERFGVRLKAFSDLRADASFMNRFVYLAAGSRMLLEHPAVGVGLENYGLLYPQYRPIEGEVVPSDELPTMVHNGYLQHAVTSGLPGLALYLILISSGRSG